MTDEQEQKYKKNLTDEQKQKNRDYQKEYYKNMTVNKNKN